MRRVLPLKCSTGLTPHSAANAASLPSRSGLSPAVARSWAAVIGPMPGWSSSRQAVWRTIASTSVAFARTSVPRMPRATAARLGPGVQDARGVGDV